MAEATNQMTSTEGLYNFFKEEHRMELADGDEFIDSLWLRAQPQLSIALKTHGLGNVPHVDSKQVNELDDIIGNQVNELRRIANPLPDAGNYYDS